VSPLVAAFLQDQEGLSLDEVMTIDSGKKVELGEKDWHRCASACSVSITMPRRASSSAC